jgi:hypothetical protein
MPHPRKAANGLSEGGRGTAATPPRLQDRTQGRQAEEQPLEPATAREALPG